MPLTPHSRLGPYDIIQALGAGGMGEVFRARDARLGRDVAIKALPDVFAADPERLARFEREARVLASLNHSNVAAIYGLEEVGGTRYLVLEFVAGETLDQRLARGALPLDEALDVARQIAAGVEAAHENGIVHRDLKPANVMLTPSGGVKVLDFGLARADAADASSSNLNLSSSPTVMYAATQAGVILGTAAYMSPEQARGKAVDRRTDVWSFGCILFEMLSGKRAYEGETVSDLVARILEREPDWTALPKNTPPRLVALIRRCLVKDARQRQRDLGDVRLELDAIAAGDAVAQPTAPAARLAPWWALAVCAIALVALGAVAALGLISLRGSRSSPALIRFALGAPAGTRLGFPADVAISPDGSSLVYNVQDSTTHLCLRTLASPDGRILPGTEHAALPFWSPDGKNLGFFADGKLRKMALDGSPPVDLCDAPDPRGGSWSPQGIIVFAPNNSGGLMRVPDRGGTPEVVVQPDSSRHERGLRYPQFLPDGRHFLYVAIGSDELVRTYGAALGGGRPVEVAKAGSMARYAAPGVLLYLDTGVNQPRRRLLVQKFDAGRLVAQGDAHVLMDRVSAVNFGYSNVAAGPGGVLVVQHTEPSSIRLFWRDAQGKTAGTAIDHLVSAGGGNLSRDGRRYAYSGWDPQDVYVADLASGVSRRLTFENRAVSQMVWSPDNSRIAFSRLTNNGWEARLKSSDGSGSDSLLFRGPGLFTYTSDWSHDGKWILLTCSTPTGQYELWRLPTDGGAPSKVTRIDNNVASLSPDGHWLAYTNDDDGRSELFVQSFPDGGAKYQVSLDDVTGGGWMPKGLSLLLADHNRWLSRVDFSTEGGFHQGATTRVFPLISGEGCDGIDPSGRFLMTSLNNQSQLTSLDVLVGWDRLLSVK